MRLAPWSFLSIFISIFSLLANGGVFACAEEMASDMGKTHEAVYALSDAVSFQDSTVSEIRTAESRWIDCRSWCDFDQPRLSAGKSQKETVTVTGVIGHSPEKSFQTVEIHPVFKNRRPPPNPPDDRDYASLVGIVKNLN